MTNDILLAGAGGDVSVLIFLDLSSAVDHNILFHKLQSLCDIFDTVLS